MIARWSSADITASTTLIASSISQQGGLAVGRWTIQIRSFRLPEAALLPISSTGVSREGTGRHLVVVRSSDRLEGVTFIEDPKAPLRRQRDELRKQHLLDGTFDDTSAHTRWTHTGLGAAPPSLSSSSSSGSTAAAPPPPFPFDQLLQRVLCVSPSPISPNTGAWLQRSSHIIIEGHNFILGDFSIRVGGVQLRGSAAASPKGIIVEATYLPIPSLSTSSQLVHNFLSDLLPSAAIASGEIQFLHVDDEAFYEVGLARSSSDLEGAAGPGEWTDSHSAYMLMQRFKQEELF